MEIDYGLDFAGDLDANKTFGVSKMPKYNLSSLKIFIALLFLPIGLLAHGPIGSGGGKGIVCTDDAYNSTVYLADTFKYFYNKDNEEFSPDKTAKTDLPDVTSMEILQGAVSYFDEKYPEKIYEDPSSPGKKISFGKMIIYSWNKLQREFVTTPLPIIPDDNIKIEKLPKQCRQLVQIAAQDFDKNKLTINSSLLFELQSVEAGFLWLHETFLAIRGTSGDTTPIRKKVAAILAEKNLETFRGILQRIKSKRLN